MTNRRDFIAAGGLAIAGRPPEPGARTRAEDERLCLAIVRTIGGPEALRRLTLSGPYQPLWDAVQQGRWDR